MTSGHLCLYLLKIIVVIVSCLYSRSTFSADIALYIYIYIYLKKRIPGNFLSVFPCRFLDFSVSFSPPQPKTDRGGLSITSHFAAQTSRPVFLNYFLLRLPATAQDSQGDPLWSFKSCAITLVIVQTIWKILHFRILNPGLEQSNFLRLPFLYF